MFIEKIENGFLLENEDETTVFFFPDIESLSVKLKDILQPKVEEKITAVVPDVTTETPHD